LLTTVYLRHIQFQWSDFLMINIKKQYLLILRICILFVGLSLAGVNVFAHGVNCNTNPSTLSGVLSYDLTAANSYCEFCGLGQIRLVVTNPSHIDMADFVVTHDFRSSGLEYVPGSTVGGGDPAISGTQLTWTATEIPALAQIDGSNNHSYNSVDIIFQVRSISGTEENLLTANRNIEADVNYNFCPTITNVPATASTGQVLLPLREPQPSIVKLGRNVDSNQGAGSYSNIVYGNVEDDVIWRIQINNAGLAGLQDLKFDDLMQNGNFQINYACPSEGEATSIANADGVGPVGNCQASSNSFTLNVDSPFGETGTAYDGSEVDVNAGGNTFIYLVGKITNSCTTNKTNTVSNVEWGCEVIPGDGGVNQTSSGAGAGTSTTTLSSLVTNSGLQIQRALTGINTGQPVGSRGLMTITITNATGGSVKNIKLRDVLPPEYVVDSTFTPTIAVTPLYGNYNGLVDTIAWTNPVAGTFPLVSTDPLDPLANVAPEFDLTSSTTHPIHADQFNMLRQGDVAVVQFRVVMIPPAFFDKVANIDVRVENTGDSTDPANNVTLSNQLYVTFEDFCNPGATQQPASYPYADNFPAFPEDIDVDITGTELIFILTNDPTQPLPLQISLTNNGGHYADDYSAYVTFGATMEVITAPAGCAATTNPPLLEVWDDPTDLPATATVYECTSTGIGTINPGQTRALNFEVIKTSDAGRLAEDDLSLRADVVGEIALSDGTLLWFPDPSVVPIVNRANNYSLDSVRARVIGFNLTKNQVGNCSENNPPPASPDVLVQIGEECSVQIDTGGWFGFQTPGFTYIAVQNIQVVDQLPDGQSYISSTDPLLTSSASITGISLNPPALAATDEGWFDWTFNQAVPAERITIKDQWFRVNATTRVLNKPVDTIAIPNQHTAQSRNILNSTFEAVFNNAVTGLDEIFTLGQSTIGYPSEPLRRVDLTVTEPNILVTKTVCNESIYGIGDACTNFVALADDGDTQDAYVYKITITNQASSGGVARAPAYNLTSTDVLDISDLMLVVPFATDGLDNDGDGLTDAADVNGEGTIIDNIIANATPATITFSHTHSDALLKIDPGSSIDFYYRVDPDDAISPVQQLTNSVTVNYDSLEGDSGNQTVVLSSNSEISGARVYNSAPTTAVVEILPLQTQPKEILQLSNSTITGGQPQPVSIGEEIQYRLRTLIPVANLKDFFIRDELPPGIRCIEAPDVDLDAAPYNAAGFFPGGTITPTCSGNLVYWYFGDQELTAATNNNLFDFPVTFIARVNNIATVNESDLISNGSPVTNAFVSYRDKDNFQVTQNFSQFDLIVNEPVIALVKSYESAVNDAGDVITVTVTATNTGTAAAYNLRVLDDLTSVSNLTFLNNVAGTDPPDNVDTATLGVNQPIFSWAPANPDNTIAPAQSISFTFDVQVNDGAEPHEVLDNIIQASWTSLPDQNTALNIGGTIGTDGSATGMRIGAVPNLADLINDYETNATTFTTVPALTISKNDLSPGLLTEPGAHKNFEVVINLPEGTTNGLVVNDELDRSGLSYVLSNNAGFDITYSFNGIASINGSPPAEAVFNSFPSDATSGNAVWNIGTIVTTSEDDTTGAPVIDPSITINYFARINNDLNTNVGSTLENYVTTFYLNGEDASTESLVDNVAAITVTESVLTVNKSASLISAAPITGGDIVEYAVTISNTGNAEAYDVNVVDTLPLQVELDTTFTPTAKLDGVDVAGFVTAPLNSPAGPLIWGNGNTDNSLDVPIGSTLVITYRVEILAGAQANVDLTNSVLIDWTSLNAASSYERTGNGCPTITLPNDYCAGPATSTITVVDNNSFSKAVISDTFIPANDSIVRIGDIVTYQLSLNLQEGTTQSVSVLDVLPTGMSFVDIVSINGDTTADYTPPAAGVGSNYNYSAIVPAALPVAGQTGNLNFTIGNVTNDPAGDATTDTLFIIYRARVNENFLTHVASTTLINTATMSYLDGVGNPVVDPARLQNSSGITVFQPIMAAPTKIDRGGRTTNTNVQVATDVMNFRVSSCNTTGLAPAYSIQLTDSLATQLNETSITGPVNGLLQPDVYINGVLQVSGVGYNYTPPAIRGGTMVFELLNPVLPGQCVDVDYDIGFYTDFGANQMWDNTFDLDEYWSLPVQSGQLYPALGPATFTMLNNNPFVPPSKVMTVPVSGEATVGETVTYQITIPISNAARFDILLTDTLDPSLEYISATEISGNNFVFTDNTVAPGNISFSLDVIPAGQEAIFEIVTRVANNVDANAGINFTNTSNYTHTNAPGDVVIFAGSSTTATSLTIVEPLVALTKSVVNDTNPGNQPVGGDILRYTLTLNASGAGAGDNFSDAFDISIADQLSLGLLYQAGTVTIDDAGSFINDPVITGDGITTIQTLDWNLASATADIDISEGSTVTITYDVLVLDSVLANQSLTNSAIVQWTGLEDINVLERDGSATPVSNDYFTAPATTTLISSDNTNLTKSRITDTFNTADDNVRIGDLVQYELRLAIQEGQTNNVVLVDTLPQGLAFENVVSINGDSAAPFTASAPFLHNVISAVPSGDPITGTSSVTYTIGNITNVSDADNTNDDFVIIYTARVLDTVHAQLNNITLTNNAQLNYLTATGVANRISSQDIIVLQPLLDLTKSAVAAGGNSVLDANELVIYTVDITNNGTAPAYDTVIEDIIPLGMRNGTATVTPLSMTLVNSATTLTNITPTYDVNTGLVRWDLDTGIADSHTIPVGEILRVAYQVQTDANIGAGLSLTNQVTASLYYSLDDEAVPVLNGVTGVREIYGPSNTAITTLTTPAPGALLKENPAVLEVSIGEIYSYQITVPAVPVATTLHDVRILDDLIASDADLNFVSVTKVSGSVDWTPVNTGTVTNVVIEDVTTGIDIPANEQIVISLTVQVANTGTNFTGLTFNNTADYTFNQVENDVTTQQSGTPYTTTPDMTIVGPDTLTLEKSGPADMRIGIPEVFTLNVHNTGTAPAWDITVSDLLPSFEPLPGGMCNVSPDTVTAQIFLANGITPVTAVLTQGIDYVVSFLPEPDCVFSITMQSALAMLPEDNRLIITYQASLDTDTPQASALTNVAGTTEWFSQDTAGSGATDETRPYNEILSDGSTTIIDHEDAHTIDVDTPVILIQKRVVNLTTGQDPGSNAQPGDTLRYSIFIQNQSNLLVSDFDFVDDLDALNAVPVFLPGSLNIVSAPLGSNTSNTDAFGGSKNSGRIDIRGLALDVAGNPGDTVNIEFDVTLVPVITNGTVVLNQGFAQSIEINLPTDDPNVNGVDDPLISGDENATETLISSAAQFEVFKTSDDMTDDPDVLISGDTLRYTITVKNIGDEDAINSFLRDQLPANTTYVAESTTLNGNPISDLVVDELPLISGIAINAAENTLSGYMRGDATALSGNIATITFDVIINDDLVNGTIISNQAFVTAEGAGSPAIPETPSDDPSTPTLNDPTIDVVGNQPLLNVQKTVLIQIDNSTPNILDPGDIIRYTITVTNNGATEATEVTLLDLVPADTTYIADSVTLNGMPYDQPDAGVSPLITPIAISSSDLALPVPASTEGTITAGESAVITFDVQVNTGVAVGTVISNQGSVDSLELPTELTDADGIDSNGDQPTLIVVGNAQLLSISKDVAVIGGGPALAGGQLEYRVRVFNIGLVPAMTVLITDDLDLPVAGQMTYVPGSGLLNGLPTGVSFTDPVITADYGTNYGSLEPGESAELRFIVDINNSLPIGTTLTNIAEVYWNSGLQSDSDSVSIDLGGTPGVGNLNGALWHDANFDNALDSGEQVLTGWTIDLLRDGNLLGSQISDANGEYKFNGLLPNDVGTDRYELRFSAPGSTGTTALLGLADSPVALGYTNNLQKVSNIVIGSGSNIINLNLPIDPNGVVYDSILRTPVTGATVSMLNASSQVELSSDCFDDAAQQNQVTLNSGYYKFDLNFSQPDCTAGDDYLIRITPPAVDYNATPSLVIPPTTDENTAALNVPNCPAGISDALPLTLNFCEAQASEFAPVVSVPVGISTAYYLHLTLDDAQVPEDSQLFNNHLPIDPILTSAVTITKTTPMVNVIRSQLVPYTITVTNTLPVELSDSNIIDNFPAGFKYVDGSARMNGVSLEPVRNDLRLTWENIDLPSNDTQTIKLLLIVGAAVNEGEYINKAEVFDTRTNGSASGVASATVRVIPDPAFDCSDIIGKVFDDKNLNSKQDENEEGLQGVRIVSARGLSVTSDKHGRFHVTCAAVPDASRGSNFIMKVDERSLPSGYRMTSENPRVKRATRGKMLSFNFAATIHKVVSMDLANDVFVKNSDEVHGLWEPRLNLLMQHLQKGPSVLRLSYLADTENEGLVNDRLDKLKEQIFKQWESINKYRLVIESEVFWRRGGPLNRGDFN